MNWQDSSRDDFSVRGVDRWRLSCLDAQRLKPFEIEVDDVLRIGTRPHRRFWGRCYSRAFSFVLGFDLSASRRLVHGCCLDFPDFSHRQGHAWVEIGDTVFCPSRQRFYQRDGYYRALDVIVWNSWTVEQAARLCVENEHSCGPWVLEYPEDHLNDTEKELDCPAIRTASRATRSLP